MDSAIVPSEQTAANTRLHILSLPPELRIRIFEQVIGNQTWRGALALEFTHNLPTGPCPEPHAHRTQPGSMQCRGKWCPNYSGAHESRFALTSVPAGTQSSRRTARAPSIIPLLLVCRQFQHEAAALKWQNHTFRISHDHIEAFVKRLVRYQLKALRTLEASLELGALAFSLRYNKGRGSPLLRLADMAGLRSLRLAIRWNRPRGHDSGPLEEVKDRLWDKALAPLGQLATLDLQHVCVDVKCKVLRGVGYSDAWAEEVKAYLLGRDGDGIQK